MYTCETVYIYIYIIYIYTYLVDWCSSIPFGMQGSYLGGGVNQYFTTQNSDV